MCSDWTTFIAFLVGIIIYDLILKPIAKRFSKTKCVNCGYNPYKGMPIKNEPKCYNTLTSEYNQYDDRGDIPQSWKP